MAHESAPEFEQEIMADCLTMQKELASSYNTAALETSDDTLKSVLINILTQEHQLHSAVRTAIDRRKDKNREV
ncbi:MAG: spore coat protein [Firmicutes bacterium]|nr:spore coat protein [Bacillota bacterium]